MLARYEGLLDPYSIKEAAGSSETSVDIIPYSSRNTESDPRRGLASNTRRSQANFA
jgi:hypothetical protein